MSGSSIKMYVQSIDKVCDYIYAHLDEDLSVDVLADVAGFSKYHFHRQFSSYTGINIYRFVQLVRLKRASYHLVFNKDYKIIDIAYDAGFESPEAFSRAFKKTFKQTPSAFRREPKWAPWHDHYTFKRSIGTRPMDITITRVHDTKVAVFEHKGPKETLNYSVSMFIEWRKASGLSPVKTSATFGIPYSDPATVDPADFRFDCCGAVEEDVPDNPQGVVTKTIPGGRCAVFRHTGPLDETMDDKIRSMYTDWLPSSGESLRDFPCYFQYQNLFPDVSEHELITDIYLPLA